MTKIHIDHEAAKDVCHARLAQGMHPSSSDRNITRALIDLHAQLAAERARVEALAGFVCGLNIENYSEAMKGVKVILEYNAHAQGDEA